MLWKILRASGAFVAAILGALWTILSESHTLAYGLELLPRGIKNFLQRCVDFPWIAPAILTFVLFSLAIYSVLSSNKKPRESSEPAPAAEKGYDYLGDVLHYIACGSAWGKWRHAQALANGPTTMTPWARESDAATVLVQELEHGRIVAYGQEPGSYDFNPIPLGFWGMHHIFMGQSGRQFGHPKIVRRGVITDVTPAVEDYAIVRIKAADVEEKWPKRETLADTQRRRWERKSLLRNIYLWVGRVVRDGAA